MKRRCVEKLWQIHTRRKEDSLLSHIFPSLSPPFHLPEIIRRARKRKSSDFREADTHLLIYLERDENKRQRERRRESILNEFLLIEISDMLNALKAFSNFFSFLKSLPHVLASARQSGLNGGCRPKRHRETGIATSGQIKSVLLVGGGSWAYRWGGRWRELITENGSAYSRTVDGEGEKREVGRDVRKSSVRTYKSVVCLSHSL